MNHVKQDFNKTTEQNDRVLFDGLNALIDELKALENGISVNTKVFDRKLEDLQKSVDQILGRDRVGAKMDQAKK